MKKKTLLGIGLGLVGAGVLAVISGLSKNQTEEVAEYEEYEEVIDETPAE